MWIYECTYENTNIKKGKSKTYLSLFRAYTPFDFRKRLFSILTHGFSKTHPPQFLNNKYVLYLNIIINQYYYHYICLYISYDTVVQRLYFRSWSKNVLTHIFLFGNWPYTYTFIFITYYSLITRTDLQKKNV